MRKITLLISSLMIAWTSLSHAQTVAGDPLTIELVLDNLGVSHVSKSSITVGNNMGSFSTLGPQPADFPGVQYVTLYRATGLSASLGITLKCNYIYASPAGSNYYSDAYTSNSPGTSSGVRGNGTDFSLDTSRPVQIRSDSGLIKIFGKDGYAYLLYVQQEVSQQGDYVLELSPTPFTSPHSPKPRVR